MVEHPFAQRLIFLVLFILMLPGVAAAQAIPPNIPDTPGESPMDREKERLRERHLGTPSRLFALGEVGYTFAAARFPAMAQMSLGGGYQIEGHTVLYASVASWATETASDGVGFTSTQSVVAVALGLDVGMDRLTTSLFLAQHGALGLTVGVLDADQDYFFAEVTPKFILRLNHLWSAPLGVKFGTALVSSETVLPYMGLSVGIRRHVGQREKLE